MERADAIELDAILMAVKYGRRYIIDGSTMPQSEYAQKRLYAKIIEEDKLAFVSFSMGQRIEIQMIKPNGTVLLDRGGFTKMLDDVENKSRKSDEINRLTKINLELQNNDLEHKAKIRKQESIIRLWQVISAILGFISLLFIFLKYK